MKAFIGMLVAISLISGGSAYAESAKKSRNGVTAAKKQAKRAKLQKKSVSAQQSEAAPVAGTTGGATAAAAAPAAQTTSTPIATATAEAAPSRWTFLFDTWNEASVEDTNFGRGEFEAAETIRVGYKLSPVMSLSLTNTIVHSWGTTADNRKVFSVEDPYIMLAHSKLLGTLPAGLKSKGYVRIYPGVSEGSRNKGQMAFLRGQFNLGRELGKVVSVAWETQPRYYFQSYKTYDTKEIRSDDGQLIKGSSEKANVQARIKHFGNASFNLSSKFNAYQNLGMDYVWYHSDPEATNPANRDVPHAEFLFAETGVGYSLNDNVSFTAGIYSELARNLLTQTNEFSIYRDNESLYFLEGTVTF